MKTQVIVFAAFIAFAQAEIFNRPCRSIEEYGGAHTPFSPADYLGLWFEIERYEQPFQRGQDCVEARYSLNETDGSIIVDNRAKDLSTLTRNQDIGRAVISFPDENPLRGLLNVTFPNQDIVIANYWILSTDYVNYAVVVSCSNLPLSRSFESYWLLSRTPKITPEARRNADAIIDRHLDRSRFRITNQDQVICALVP